MFKLALIQMKVEGGEKRKNLAHANEMITEASSNHADLIVLPEAMNLGWTHPSAKSDAEEIPDGETCRMLIRAAQSHAVFICSGLIERVGDVVYNAAVLISPEGTIILRHCKINELDIGHNLYSQGTRLNVCKTDLGTIGLMICADAFAEDRVLSRALCYMGADIIISPCSWAVPPGYDNTKEPCGKQWYDHYAPVARRFKVWIAGVSNVGRIEAGPWKDFDCIGNSLLIDPDGNIVVEGPFGVDAETILYADVTPLERPARGTTWIEFWNEKRSNI